MTDGKSFLIVKLSIKQNTKKEKNKQNLSCLYSKKEQKKNDSFVKQLT